MDNINEFKKPRIVLLYRASTTKQTDSENDIPLQRDILKPWAEQQGYEFVREFVEGGISGFKVSADKRDALIEIKAMAERREFDILGIYMSDRLGRIADETPLIVSYLNARGIKVISYREGEITANTHTDKLLTYIRYWQAEGESLKTSARVTDAGVYNVRSGKWRGGCPPYGYHSVSHGTLNNKGKPIFDIEIHPETSEVVKTIFRLYGKEHYGGKGIARYLNDHNIPTAEGGMWNCSLVLKLLKNKIYMGIYELYRTKKDKQPILSPVMPHLVIVSEEDFNAVQTLLKANNLNPNAVRPTRRGSLLLTGLLYCGECGRKYTTATFKQKRRRENGDIWEYDRKTYRCSAYLVPKSGKQDCSQKIINADVLEELVISDAKDYLTDIDKEKLMRSQVSVSQEKKSEVSDRLKKLSREITQKEKEVGKLKDQVVKVILGESSFSEELLSSLIKTKEAELVDLKERHLALLQTAAELDAEITAQKSICENLDTWAERFDRQDLMDKKAMLINIIDHIKVYGDTKIETRYKIQVSPSDYVTRNLSEYCEKEENAALLYPGFVYWYSLATIMIAYFISINYNSTALKSFRLWKQSATPKRENLLKAYSKLWRKCIQPT